MKLLTPSQHGQEKEGEWIAIGLWNSSRHSYEENRKPFLKAQQELQC